MNKRAIFIFVLVIIFVIFFYFGFKYQRDKDQEEIIKNDMVFDENENDIIENETLEAAAQEEKTTPNTVLVLKKYYTKCEHTITNKATIPEEMVNLTKEEIESKYKEWNLEKFSKDEIVLRKDFEEFCNEHYYLKEENGYVNIYSVDEEGKFTLKEENVLSCEYLTETDRIELKNGIQINTKEELNKILEDFEA